MKKKLCRQKKKKRKRKRTKPVRRDAMTAALRCGCKLKKENARKEKKELEWRALCRDRRVGGWVWRLLPTFQPGDKLALNGDQQWRRRGPRRHWQRRPTVESSGWFFSPNSDVGYRRQHRKQHHESNSGTPSTPHKKKWYRKKKQKQKTMAALANVVRTTTVVVVGLVGWWSEIIKKGTEKKGTWMVRHGNLHFAESSSFMSSIRKNFQQKYKRRRAKSDNEPFLVAPLFFLNVSNWKGRSKENGN